MSVDLNTVIPVNGLNDYIAQSPKDDAAAATALSEQPSLNGVVHASSQSMEIVVSSEDDDDVSAAATDVPSSMYETVGSPLDGKGEDNLVEDKKSDITDTDSSLVYEPLADPYEHQQPPPQQVDPVDVPDSNIAGPSSSSDEVSENETKQEVVDLGTDPHLYEVIEKKVGYDRGLEANHIVGATEKNGKLMFLIVWKNSVDGEADLLEATEVYKKSPQVAIKYFEERLCYIEKRN